jgi:hypothetical protein
MSDLIYLTTKYLITAAIVVGVSELVKINERLGALIAALPTVTILVLIWMYLEDQPPERIANHAWYTLWYVIPTLPMFMIFPIVYAKWSFWLALVSTALLTILCFVFFAYLMDKFGIRLF